MYTKKTRADLETQIDTVFPDNTNRDIDADDLRLAVGDANLSYEHLSEGGRDLTAEAFIRLEHAKGNVYNLIGTARTGNMEINQDGCLIGATALIRHNDSSTPAITIPSSAGASLVFTAPDATEMADFYATGTDNYILITCLDNTLGAEVFSVQRYSAAVTGGGGGAVSSVNTQTGAVVLDPDDLDDASTSHKFVDQALIDKVGLIEPNATSDQTGVEIVSEIDTELGQTDWKIAGLSNPLTSDLDAGGNNITNLGNTQNFESSSVTLTAQALVAVLLNNPLGTFYGTGAAPATSGSVSVSAAGVPGGCAYITYQALLAPTITGITDIDVATSWDVINKNVFAVFQHADGTYFSKYLYSHT